MSGHPAFHSGFSSNFNCFHLFLVFQSRHVHGFLCESVLIPRLFSTCATSRSCQKFNGGRVEGVENGNVCVSSAVDTLFTCLKCLHHFAVNSVLIAFLLFIVCFSCFLVFVSHLNIKLRDFRLQLDNRATGFMGVRQNPGTSDRVMSSRVSLQKIVFRICVI